MTILLMESAMTFLSAAGIGKPRKNMMMLGNSSIGHHPWTMSGFMSVDVGSARRSWSSNDAGMMIAYVRAIDLFQISYPWVPRMMIGFQRELTSLMTKRVLILPWVHCPNQREKSSREMDHLSGMMMLLEHHHHR